MIARPAAKLWKLAMHPSKWVLIAAVSLTVLAGSLYAIQQSGGQSHAKQVPSSSAGQQKQLQDSAPAASAATPSTASDTATPQNPAKSGAAPKPVAPPQTGQALPVATVKPFVVPTGPSPSPSNGTGYSPQPAPVFSLALSAPYPGPYNPLGYKITILPDANSVNYSYSVPTVVSTPNGLPCNTRDNGVYNPYNERLIWSWACVPFMAGDTIETYHFLYGDYPITFSVTGTNGYGVKAAQTVTGVIHFPDPN